MTEPSRITNENAATIGKPMFEKIIQSFVKSDRANLIQHYPELQNWMTAELFDEAAQNLNRLGEVRSIAFASYEKKDDHHLLLWLVDYSDDENDVLWNLHLNDDQDEIKVMGFGFNR